MPLCRTSRGSISHPTLVVISASKIPTWHQLNIEVIEGFLRQYESISRKYTHNFPLRGTFATRRKTAPSYWSVFEDENSLFHMLSINQSSAQLEVNQRTGRRRVWLGESWLWWWPGIGLRLGVGSHQIWIQKSTKAGIHRVYTNRVQRTAYSVLRPPRRFVHTSALLYLYGFRWSQRPLCSFLLLPWRRTHFIYSVSKESGYHSRKEHPLWKLMIIGKSSRTFRPNRSGHSPEVF